MNHPDTDGNAAEYNSAFTYAMSPPYQPIPVGSDTYAQQSQYYYTPSQSTYNNHYDSELRFDEDQPQTSIAQSQQPQQYISYAGGNQYAQNTAHGYYETQAPTSPTAQRWSNEPCAEERMRLGLSRYATQEEVEEARRALHEVTRQADASGPSGRQ